MAADLGSPLGEAALVQLIDHAEPFSQRTTRMKKGTSAHDWKRHTSNRSKRSILIPPLIIPIEAPMCEPAVPLQPELSRRKHIHIIHIALDWPPGYIQLELLVRGIDEGLLVRFIDDHDIAEGEGGDEGGAEVLGELAAKLVVVVEAVGDVVDYCGLELGEDLRHGCGHGEGGRAGWLAVTGI
jgi:hypothetical protein